LWGTSQSRIAPAHLCQHQGASRVPKRVALPHSHSIHPQNAIHYQITHSELNQLKVPPAALRCGDDPRGAP
jgi:hypothetical protein